MRKIPLKRFDGFDSKTILETIIYAPEPNKGLTVEDMRKRFKLLDAIDETNGSGEFVVLDDGQYDLLVKLMKQTQFRAMHRDLLQVLDDIEKAESVSAMELMK
jgi:hypothetical protein